MRWIDGLDGFMLAVTTVFSVVPAIVFLWWGLRPLGRRVDDWAAARGVPLTTETRRGVIAWLQRSRRWRTVGFTAGWLVPYLWMWATRTAMGFRPDGIVCALVGYVLGGLAAELTAARATRPTGAAELTQRNPGDHLPRWARRLAWVVAATSVATVAVSVAMPMQSPQQRDLVRVAAVGVGVLVLLAGVETLPRLITGRPQPFRSDAMLRADDAMRSWSACAATGALLALMLSIVAGQWFSLAVQSDVQAIRWGTWLAVPLPVVAVLIFINLSAYEESVAPPRHRQVARP